MITDVLPTIESDFKVRAASEVGGSAVPEGSAGKGNVNPPALVVRVRAEYLIPPTKTAASHDPATAPVAEVSESKKGLKRLRAEENEKKICLTVSRGEDCQYGNNCRNSHDVLSWLATKPPDLGPSCYQFDTWGHCASGLMCRYGSAHIDFTLGINLDRDPILGGVAEKLQINVLGKEVQSLLRKKKYGESGRGADFNTTPYDQKVKLVDFRNKVYVAPLTTVGNLPFRRILKDWGADITCGEMAMAQNLLNGQSSEWALLRRHSSEDCFGVQIAGCFTDSLRDIARVLNKETATDFVDLNCGCPIDLLCQKGCGAALMNKPARLLDIVSAVTKQLTTRPMTVKIRTGWNDNDPTAHLLVPKIQKIAKGRVACVFIHGRSRQQRYSRLADWDYIAEVAKSQNPELPLIPVVGNGDILSYDDWANHQSLLSEKLEGDAESMGLCSCAMIGRGALIKPWLPTEIKQQTTLDVSASTRLDMLKKFCSYGMEHWGSDQKGIDTIRRFLLEWLSFLHRYVPSGLLELSQKGSVISQKMNQRPPHYFGRCDLETLLASSNSRDWVRISEMLLGPCPENFSFAPKHRSSSYAPPQAAVTGGGATVVKTEDEDVNG